MASAAGATAGATAGAAAAQQRVYAIRAGPGDRARLEYLQGYIKGVSDAHTDKPSAVCAPKQARLVAEGLQELVGTPTVVLHHDGATKSVAMFTQVQARLKELAGSLEAIDGMTDKPTGKAGEDCVFNFLEARHAAAQPPPIVLFCGYDTIRKLLFLANVKQDRHHLGPCAGSVTTIDFPLGSSTRKPVLNTLADCRFSLALPGAWGNAVRKEHRQAAWPSTATTLRPLELMFGGVGGARSFIVHATGGDDAAVIAQASRLADGLRELVSAGSSKFLLDSHVSYNAARPRILHDGAPRSMISFVQILAEASFHVEDDMRDKPVATSSHDWLLERLQVHRADATVLQPVLLVCGPETIRELLALAGMALEAYELDVCSGSVTVVDYPPTTTSPDIVQTPTVHALGDSRLSLQIPGAAAQAVAAAGGGAGGAASAGSGCIVS